MLDAADLSPGSEGGAVRYVSIEAGDRGTAIDPLAYLERLSELAPRLPPGARAFASDPDHYDFWGERCVKDLEVEALSFGADESEPTFAVHFRHNCWRHEEDLRITYRGLADLSLSIDPDEKWRGQVVVLDEVLPHERGCSHEIALHAGTLTIVCADLEAVWVPADCPEQRRS